MEAVTNFIFLGSKITADGDFSHEIKRHFLLGRKAMTKLDSVLKSRDIILPTNIHVITAMVFLVVTYGYEIWNIKKAEHLRTRILSNCGAEEDSWESPGLQGDQTSQPQRKPVLNIHWKEYSLLLKLTLQYFGHLMWRADSLEKTLMLWKDWKDWFPFGEGSKKVWYAYMVSPTQ